MGDLRREENRMRDWIISELQLSRGRQEANENAIRIAQENLRDCEQQYMQVAGELNSRLARTETLYESLLAKHLNDGTDLQRLSAVLDSYLSAEDDRLRRGGNFYEHLFYNLIIKQDHFKFRIGGLVTCLKLKNPDGLSRDIKNVYKKLMKYREVKEDADCGLRYRVSTHVQEIKFLQEQVRRLEAENRSSIARAVHAEAVQLELQKRLDFTIMKLQQSQVNSLGYKADYAPCHS
jgi:hypothetical protein